MDIEKMLKKKIPIAHEKRDAFVGLLKYSLIFFVTLIYFEVLLRTQIGFNGFVWQLILFIPFQAITLGLLSKWLSGVFKRNVRPVILSIPTAFYIFQCIYVKLYKTPFFVFMLGAGGTLPTAKVGKPWNTVSGCIGWMLLMTAPILICLSIWLFKKFVKLSDDVYAELKNIYKYAFFFALALIYWELLLRTQIGFDGMTWYYLLFIPAQSMFFATLTGWFKRKGNRILTPIVMVLPFAFYVTQLIYFRIFGSLFSISMIGMGTAAIKNFGWALWTTIKESVLWILLCLAPIIISVLISVFYKKAKFKGFRHWIHGVSFVQVIALWMVGALLLGVFGTGDGTAYEAYHSSLIDTDTASNRLGVFTNSAVELASRLFGSSEDGENEEVIVPVTPPSVVVDAPLDSSPNVIDSIDFNTLKTMTDKKSIQELCDYYAAINGTNKNEYTGMLEGYNLIYICAESYCQYAIDPVVTPTLYRLSKGGIVLNNYYNSFKNTTTNGEFAFMTGLWPDVSRAAKNGTAVGSFAQSSKNLIPFALGNMFKTKGLESLAYHNYYGHYYRRSTTHPNLGYVSKFMKAKSGEEGMTFTTRWPASDYEMMEQSVDEFIDKDQFSVYYMTFSGHGPYSSDNPMCVKNIKAVRELTKDRDLSEGARQYLAANMELDKGLEYLVKRLEDAGKLDKTLIVLTGDHYPYYLIDSSYNSLAGEKVEPNFDKYRSSCIMYCSSLETMEIDTPCCNVDILPTILNLFGFEYDSRLLPGSDIFSTTTHIAAFYNKSFVTDKVKYNSQKGTAQWLEGSESMSDSDKEEYLNYVKQLVKTRYAASLEVMETDFFRFVYENSGLLPKTE